ncbi:lipase family protein [Smaragdicoccus niigatensis]|uniref:lipase family protein n=1 Tax=Smaragdicoccus niigatensis TaxID=359359 RepID=UPI00035CA01C|nr:lipase family protein [Smaragdicoccus niigatensis]
MSVSVELSEFGATTAPVAPAERRRWDLRKRPLLPADDPFYRPPRTFAALEPGTVIRTRYVHVAALSVVPQRIDAVQLLYRSTDLDGHPEAAVTTVLLPRGADPAVPRPVVAYQCAIDVVTSQGFPSYLLQRGAKTLGSAVPIEFFFIGAALRKGWAVVVTDHEGLDGRFGAPREPGYRVLDGLRAAMNHGVIRSDVPVAAWGYSGGGMATSWVVEMAGTYAPEINLVGGVLGAPVGNPHNAFWRLNGTFHAGLAALVIAGIRPRYPALSAVIHDHVTLEGRRLLDLAGRLTTVGAILRLAHTDFDDYVDEPLKELLGTPEVVAVLDDLQLGTHKPSCPLLVVQPVHDQIISVTDVDGQVERYISAGADVTYIRVQFAEHLSGLPLSVPTALEWISARVQGRPTTPGIRTVWTFRSRPFAYASLCATTVRMLIGLPITPVVSAGIGKLFRRFR